MIQPKKNRLNPAFYDKNMYKSRHLIETFFAKLKQCRAIATRYNIFQFSKGYSRGASIVVWINWGQVLEMITFFHHKTLFFKR